MIDWLKRWLRRPPKNKSEDEDQLELPFDPPLPHFPPPPFNQPHV
jgi:hypothetical protein